MSDHHEPRCPDCGRYDANCKCDWPMPAIAPTTPPDDEDREVPADDWPGYRLTSMTPEQWEEARDA